jgi:hypothetical protein
MPSKIRSGVVSAFADGFDAVRVRNDDVGERAARIDRYAKSHAYVLPGTKKSRIRTRLTKNCPALSIVGMSASALIASTQPCTLALTARRSVCSGLAPRWHATCMLSVATSFAAT